MLHQFFGAYWEPSENRLRAGDVNEILTWIDYCVVKRLRPGTFENSIVAHLHASCQRDFTFKQIDVKVEEIWKSRLNSSLPDGEALLGHTAVYRVGTKAMRGRDFSDERAQVIRARVQELMKQPIPEYAKRGLPGVQKKRKVDRASTGDEVAKRLFKQKKTSHLNSFADSILRRSPRVSISVQVRHSSFVSMRIAKETNTGASRFLQLRAEPPRASTHERLVALNLLSLNASKMQSYAHPLIRQLAASLKTRSLRARGGAWKVQKSYLHLQGGWSSGAGRAQRHPHSAGLLKVIYHAV